MKSNRAIELRAFVDWRKQNGNLPEKPTFLCAEKEDRYYFIVEKDRKMIEHWAKDKGGTQYRRII